MRERGEGSIRLILTLMVTAAVIFAGIRIVPVYVRSNQFHDYIRQEAKFARVDTKPVEEVQRILHNKALELKIPVERSMIKVGPGPGGIQITVQYVIPIDLYFYTYVTKWDFHEDTSSSF